MTATKLKRDPKNRQKANLHAPKCPILELGQDCKCLLNP